MSESNANFTPVFNGYTGQKPFRYWCQTVLPLVYDDSLSYYELLNKVVTYLNNVISDVGTVEDNVQSLLTAYTQLQGYVNDYFNNLDVQDEIDNKLDELVENGTMSALVSTYASPVFVSSVEEMRIPSKTYVLNSNSHIYTYNGTNFVDTGLTYGSGTNAVYQNVNLNSNNYTTYGINSFTDLNANAIYGISETITEEMISGLPEYGKYATVAVFQPDRPVRSQVVYLYFCYTANANDSTVYYNVQATASVFTGWIPLQQNTEIYTEGYILRHSDIHDTYSIYSINDLQPNRFYALKPDITEDDLPNLPQYGRLASICTLNYNSTNKGFRMIFYMTYTTANSPKIYLGYSLGATPNNYLWVCVNQQFDSYNIENLITKVNTTTYNGAKVVAVGDSICAGTGSTTYDSSVNGRLIVPEGVHADGNARYAHDNETNHGANSTSAIGKLRYYLYDKYNVNMVNNGIGGFTYKGIYDCRDYIFSMSSPEIVNNNVVYTQEVPDIAIIFLGNNNRSTATLDRPAEIATYLPRIYEYLNNLGVKPIFVTNTTDLRVSTTLPITSEGIANMIKTECAKIGIKCYDLNTLVKFACYVKGIAYDSSLFADGNLHPNDNFYDIIYECIKYLIKV